uniref:Neuroplastin n=1 Tax=Hadrurus spadix TaxID=141984 RepID=A0A1W7RA30_9SCOR
MFGIWNAFCLILCSSCLIFVSANSIITNEEYPGSGIIMDLSKTLTLQCNTSQPSTLTWYKDGVLINATDDRISIFQDENKLIVEKAELEDAGIYVCVFNETTNATIQVFVKTFIEPFPKSLNLVQGDTLRLQCRATGFPVPKITWQKGDEIINATEERIQLKPNDKNLTDGMLIISDLDYEDRANYVCVADNEVTGAVNASIVVRIKDKLAALWPFLGICAEVAILCAIIFIYEKKRVKPDFDESDTDQIPESKNVADKDKVPDVRQRK